jgi:transcriptional regulator with XRE-family HTH domain
MGATKINLSNRIKDLRERCGISQANLSKQLSVSRSSVNAWELGISIPTTQYITEMAKIFHVSTDFILGVDDARQISLRDMDEEEVKLVYGLVNYIHKNKHES